MVTILAVDDDQDDLEIFQSSIKEINPAINCILAKDGEEALAILANTIPDVVFLDINMAKMDGFECLAHIKSDSSLKNIPIVIYSTALQSYNAQYLYDRGVNYLVKQPTLKKTIESLRSVLKKVLPIQFHL